MNFSWTNLNAKGMTNGNPMNINLSSLNLPNRNVVAKMKIKAGRRFLTKNSSSSILFSEKHWSIAKTKKNPLNAKGARATNMQLTNKSVEINVRAPNKKDEDEEKNKLITNLSAIYDAAIDAEMMIRHL